MGRIKEIWMRKTALGYGDVPDKYVCADCFDDYAIKEFIKGNAVEEICSYCANESDKPIAAKLEIVVDFICQGINTEWEDPANSMAYESREGGYQGATVITSDELVRYEIEELFNTNEAVLDDIVYSMIGSHDWCQQDPYGLRREEALSLSWEKFSDQVKHHTRYIFFRLEDEERRFYDLDMIPVPKMLDRIANELSGLADNIDLFTTLDIGGKIFRARIHDEGKELSKAKDFGTVPIGEAVYSNRMSPAGIPMLYGAFDSETAYKEIVDDGKDNQGKVVSLATFKTLKKIRVLNLTNLPEIPSLFDPQLRHLRSSLIFLRDFVKELSQPISKDGNEHIDYVPTQVFTEYIRYLYRDREGAILEGILYPSSKNINGISCVLFIENEHCCDEHQVQIDELDTSDDSNTEHYLVLHGQIERIAFK